MSAAIDLTGQRFGRLVAIAFVEYGANHAALWNCRCDCGAERIVTRTSLLQQYTRSCGCLRRERTAQRNRQRSRIERSDISVSAATIAKVRSASRRTGASMRQIVTAAVAGVGEP